MPRKTSFCNRALLRSDVKRYWPLLFLYVAVGVMIVPLPILQAGRWMVSVEQIQAEIHNTIYNALFGSIVMALLFGCLTAMAVWSYLMTSRAVGLLHALPVTRTEQFLSHSIAGLGMLTVGNVFIFLLSAACCAGRSYVDWAILGAWLLLTELMELFFFALASLCAMATGWLLAIPVLYGAVRTGIAGADVQLLEMAAVFRLPPGRRLRSIWLPAVLPAFRQGCSVALGICWKSGIAAEVIGLPNGSIGDALYRAKITLSTGELFAWTFVIILLSAVFEKLFLALLDKAVAAVLGEEGAEK